MLIFIERFKTQLNSVLLVMTFIKFLISSITCDIFKIVQLLFVSFFLYFIFFFLGKGYIVYIFFSRQFVSQCYKKNLSYIIKYIASLVTTQYKKFKYVNDVTNGILALVYRWEINSIEPRWDRLQKQKQMLPGFSSSLMNSLGKRTSIGNTRIRWLSKFASL